MNAAVKSLLASQSGPSKLAKNRTLSFIKGLVDFKVYSPCVRMPVQYIKIFQDVSMHCIAGLVNQNRQSLFHSLAQPCSRLEGKRPTQRTRVTGSRPQS